MICPVSKVFAHGSDSGIIRAGRAVLSGCNSRTDRADRLSLLSLYRSDRHVTGLYWCLGKNNAHFDAIYSGFLTGAEQISQVLDFIRQFREEHTLLLVDPVMGMTEMLIRFYSGAVKWNERTDAWSRRDHTESDGSLSAGRHPGKCLTSLQDKHGSAEAGRRCGTAAAKKPHTHRMSWSPVSNAVMRNIPSFIILLPLQMEFTGTNRRFWPEFSGTGDLFASVLCGCCTRAYARKMRFCLPGNFYPTVSGIPWKKIRRDAMALISRNFLLTWLQIQTCKNEKPGKEFRNWWIHTIERRNCYGKNFICVQWSGICKYHK